MICFKRRIDASILTNPAVIHKMPMSVMGAEDLPHSR
jgi:hypothetical protein